MAAGGVAGAAARETLGGGRLGKCSRETSVACAGGLASDGTGSVTVWSRPGEWGCVLPATPPAAGCPGPPESDVWGSGDSKRGDAVCSSGRLPELPPRPCISPGTPPSCVALNTCRTQMGGCSVSGDDRILAAMAPQRLLVVRPGVECAPAPQVEGAQEGGFHGH